MENQKTLQMFCASEQIENAHTIDIDGNGEVVLTCTICGRFIKLPRGTTPESLKESIASHNKENIGQISVESIEKEKADLIASLV